MSKSKFIHTLSESKNIFALERKAIVLSFVKMFRFYWVTRYLLNAALEHSRSRLVFEMRNNFIFGILCLISLGQGEINSKLSSNPFVHIPKILI